MITEQLIGHRIILLEQPAALVGLTASVLVGACLAVTIAWVVDDVATWTKGRRARRGPAKQPLV